jgi:hypothetical protein
MNSISKRPLTNALGDAMSNGLNQDQRGLLAPCPARPL